MATRVRYAGPECGAAIFKGELEKAGLRVDAQGGLVRRSIGHDEVLVMLYVADKVADATIGLGVEGTVRRVIEAFKARGVPAQSDVDGPDGAEPE